MQPTERMFKINFSEIECEKRLLLFTIWYQWEHARIARKAYKKENEWNIKISEHGILD